MIRVDFFKDDNKVLAYDGDLVVGECDFIESEKIWNIVHTVVDKEHQGQGIARKLVECVVENAKKYNKRLVADCSYAKKLLEKNS